MVLVGRLPKISKEYSSLRSWEALMTSLNISSSPSPLLGFEKAIFEHAEYSGQSRPLIPEQTRPLNPG